MPKNIFASTAGFFHSMHEPARFWFGLFGKSMITLTVLGVTCLVAANKIDKIKEKKKMKSSVSAMLDENVKAGY